MYPSLNHKTALVTGAGTGIGRAIAQRLADEGANVLIVGRTEATLAETASYSDKITFLAADLEVEAGIESIIQIIGERYGRLDILVNNAGWAPVTPFATMKIDEYDKEERRLLHNWLPPSTRFPTEQLPLPTYSTSPLLCGKS